MTEKSYHRFTGRDLAPRLLVILGITQRQPDTWDRVIIDSHIDWATIEADNFTRNVFIINNALDLHLALSEAIGVKYARRIRLIVDEYDAVIAEVELEAVNRLEELNWDSLLSHSQTVSDDLRLPEKPL